MPKPQLKPENHERVYTHLRKAGAPLTAYQILDAMRGGGFRAPLALQRLISEGRVHRVESLSAFVPCCDPDHRHGEPMFAICPDCGAVREILQPEALDRLRKVAATIGFTVERASVELTGRCGDCAAKALSGAGNPSRNVIL